MIGNKYLTIEGKKRLTINCRAFYSSSNELLRQIGSKFLCR